MVESFPASDAPSHASDDYDTDPHEYGEHGGGIGRPSQQNAGDVVRRKFLRDRSWCRGDRGDHLMHEHVESERDDRRRAGSQEGGGEGPESQALGEDHAGPRLEGRERLLRAFGADALSGQARLQSRRLWLHHMHRQLGPADSRSQCGGARKRSRGGLGALRQPQLRGPDQSRRQDELPGVPAAGRRLRARRHHGHRLDERRPRHRRAGSTTST